MTHWMQKTGYQCVVCGDDVLRGYSTNSCCGGAVCLKEKKKK
jgi:iron-sulfur cluster repair protein YtfE (RIC family)